MTRLVRAIALLTLSASLATQGCSDASAQNRTGRVIVSGSSTVAPLMGEIAKRFERRHPGIRVDVQAGGSSRGIADARNGLADVGMVSRDLTPAESDLHPYPIARDGICMIVHRDNPTENLTRQQVVRIYTGQITQWQSINEQDAPITVVSKAQGRSTLELFLEYFDLDPRSLRPSVIIGGNQQCIKTVASNPFAIGYVSIGAAEFEAAQGTPIKPISLNGVAPSVGSVRDGSFPLSRTLNLVTTGQPTPLTKRLLEFAQSTAVHDLIEAQHFVPITH